MNKDKQNWRINSQINASEVRVIGPDNKAVGVLKLEEALEKAREKGLDLVEIAPKAKPPVVKIIEFGKFKYQEEKKAKKAKRGVKTSEVKEVRFSPFIADGDFNTRITKIKQFLNEGNKIRLVVKFKGRQMGQKSFGYDIIGRVIESLNREVNIDMEPKFIGRHLTAVISPLGKGQKNEEKQEKQTEDKKDNN